MKVPIATIGFSLFFGLVELAKRKWSLNPEITRKIVHILAGTAVAFLPWVMSFHALQVLSLIFLVVMLVSKKLNLYSSIHEVERSTYGEVYFPLVVLLLATFLPERLPFLYGMLVMSISDALANLAGEYFGRKHYQIGSSRKTYIGSLSFLLSTIAIGLVIFGRAKYLSLRFTLLLLAISLVLTITEGVLSGGLDNLILPLLGAGLIWISHGLR